MISSASGGEAGVNKAAAAADKQELRKTTKAVLRCMTAEDMRTQSEGCPFPCAA